LNITVKAFFVMPRSRSLKVEEKKGQQERSLSPFDKLNRMKSYDPYT
jgi:hypothetical protein